MQQVIDIFKQIQATNSKNEKIEIIRKNADNELFKESLVFLLDTNIVTGISKKKMNKRVSHMTACVIRNWHDCMEFVKHCNTGRDVDVGTVRCFMSAVLTEEQAEFCEAMITKSLRLGCDDKSVNKAIPNLIPTWEVQLGSGYDKLKLKKNEYFYLSQKLNGNRSSYVDGRLISRQGKEFTGMDHIICDIEALGLSDYFVDGELVRKNVDNVSDGENCRIATGIINSDAESKPEISFVVFDMFPASELPNKSSTLTYAKRKLTLEELRGKINALSLNHINVVTMLYEGSDTNQIDDWLDYAVRNDWEGLMLNKDAPYRCKRTTDLIKVKRFYTVDLEVVGVLEGEGRLSGTLGALVVEYKGNTINVGSGFTDAQRTELWNMRSELLGRIIEVKYKEESSDKKTGLKSLQFPIFVCVRELGKSISYET